MCSPSRTPRSGAVRKLAESAHLGAGDRRIPLAQVEDALEGLEAVARVLAQRRVADGQRAGAVVADEEDRAAALVGVVLLHHRAVEDQLEVVAVQVDGPAVAAPGGAGPGRVG